MTQLLIRITSAGTEPHLCDWRDFVAANELDAEEAAMIEDELRLGSGEWVFGGGAAPLITLTARGV